MCKTPLGVQSWTRKLTLWYPSFHLPQFYYHLLLKLSVPPLEPHFEFWTEHYAWREVEVNSLVYNIYAINSPFDIGCFSQKKKNNIQCPKFLQTEDKYFFPFLFFWRRGSGGRGGGKRGCAALLTGILVPWPEIKPGPLTVRALSPNHQTLGNSLVRISFRNFWVALYRSCRLCQKSKRLNNHRQMMPVILWVKVGA